MNLISRYFETITWYIYKRMLVYLYYMCRLFSFHIADDNCVASLHGVFSVSSHFSVDENNSGNIIVMYEHH